MLYFLLGAVAGASFFAGYAFKEIDHTEELVEVKPDKRLQYKWYTPELPKTMEFAGEKVPLDRWEVRERLDRDVLINYYAHGSMLYIMKLAGRVFPVIEARLKANGVPDDFKYLCVAESSLMTPTSAAGATGYWQFMKDTAPRYGLEISDEVDERYNLEKSTDAFCTYIKEAYNKFGNWTAAAASFNCGVGGYNRQVTFQGSSNYYDLALPEETNRYVFRILSFKYLISNAVKLGYILQEGDTYRPLKTRELKVDTSINNLAEWTVANGSTYKMLKLLNPWLRDRTLTVKPGKSYVIALP